MNSHTLLRTVTGDTQPPASQAVRPPLVEIEHLAKHYHLGLSFSVKSVDGVSFTIGQGEVLGLVGESGCGKSTIARLLTRQTSPTSGQVKIAGQEIADVSGEELKRLRRTVQLVFQDPFGALDPRMRIGTSMEAPLAQHRIGTREERREKVMRMLTEVGLDESFYERYPRQCSGGQLQRVVIGRALLLEPSFLICDEPTSALDASMRTQILNLLTDLKRRHGLTMLMISHDLRVVRHICDRIAVMYLGRIVEVADRDALFKTPRHPYTRALIAASMLDRTGLYAPEIQLRGDLPSPLNPPLGCRFHTRCAHAQAKCSQAEPEFEAASESHQVRCHFWRELQPDRSAEAGSP
ncbi:peptide/nickel transport system ATP-binding protein [Sinorhizobium kostiense]|uniref:Peptide/nickel transport system ATP-binding protein n=1 Tax=Sinorhizobium kostiense TaxID=76747 RepID=A0ABS4R1G1_9HYPH|nr:ABC transporter ATP-binding protein [Sinorhizobium kostiense]MBP2236731.1 peptide/nickel transport system ATP-binding protein [Sinorhizobium kostiense]